MLLVVAATTVWETAAAQEPSPAPPPPVPETREPVPAPAPPATIPVPREGTVPAPPGDRGTTPPPAVTIPSAPTIVLPRGGAPGLPPGAVFDFHPSVTLSEVYSSNFRLTGSGQENLRSSLSPGADLFINGAFVRGSTAYTLTAAHDSSRDDDVELFHAFHGEVSWEATPRFSVSVSDSFTRSDDPVQADRLRLRRDRQIFTSNLFAATTRYAGDSLSTAQYYRLSHFSSGDDQTVSHALGANVGARLGETNTGTVGYEYLISNTDRFDTSGHSVNASLSRQLDAVTTAWISGGVNLRSSEDRNQRQSNDFTIFNVSFFTTYTLPRLLSLSSSMGVSRLQADNGTESTTFSTSTNFTYQFAKATAALSIEQGFSESFAVGEDFGVVETRGVTASLIYPFTPFLQGTGTGFYRENDFPGGVSRRAREETTWGGTVVLDVTLLRWLTMALEYGYTRGTTGDEDAFTEHFARVSLSASF